MEPLVGRLVKWLLTHFKVRNEWTEGPIFVSCGFRRTHEASVPHSASVKAKHLASKVPKETIHTSVLAGSSETIRRVLVLNKAELK